MHIKLSDLCLKTFYNQTNFMFGSSRIILNSPGVNKYYCMLTQFEYSVLYVLNFSIESGLSKWIRLRCEISCIDRSRWTHLKSYEKKICNNKTCVKSQFIFNITNAV